MGQSREVEECSCGAVSRGRKGPMRGRVVKGDAQAGKCYEVERGPGGAVPQGRGVPMWGSTVRWKVPM